jgi:GDPmannose 4,6-dehydratase
MTLVAFLTGVTGMDSSQMSEFLLNKGYTVYGLVRRSSTPNTTNLVNVLRNPNFHILNGDITDSDSICHALKVISEIAETFEIYNFAAQSFVKYSFESPDYTAQVNGIGVLKLLEAVRTLNLTKRTRIFQASTSEMFGQVSESPQNENTVFNPQSPYAIAKLYAHYTSINYRDAYGMHICIAIAFNHESPRRSAHFVTRKITLGVAGIVKGTQNSIALGNLNAKRDFGSSHDYCEAIYKIMQHPTPDTFVIATNKNCTIREFAEKAFKIVGIHIKWENEGINEIGVDQHGVTRVTVDPIYFRPTEVNLLLGDYTKIKQTLGWEPKKTIDDIVSEMVTHDLNN